MVDKEITIEELEATAKHTDHQIELMEWKLDSVESRIIDPDEETDANIGDLLKTVSEVRSDYQQLRAELMEVQALQRELSCRLRTQLRVVHGKFARLRQRIAAATPQQ